MEIQIETGTPYIIFKNSANVKSNQKNIGVINGSNLCVDGSTQILTDKGYITIEDNVDQEVNVWNGMVFSPVVLKETGIGQQMIKIKASNGTSLICTPYHRFSYMKDGISIIGQAQDLVVGQELERTEFPIIDGPQTELNNETIPFNHSIKTKIEWIEKTIRKTAVINLYKKCETISVWSNDFSHLTNIRYLMQTMGCDPWIIESNNGFKLTVNIVDTVQLIDHGLKLPNLNKINRLAASSYRLPPITVTSIEKVKELSVTYCFTEQLRGTGIFNGIITFNCAEILEVSNSNEYAVCNLASICLPKFIEKKNGENFFNYDKLLKVSRILTRNLNNIIDINFYPLEKTRTTNMNNRPIGIGVQGLADVMAMFKTPFDSELARDLNKKIFETIYYGSVTESMIIAKETEPYPTFKGSPFSHGDFQFNLWGLNDKDLSGMWNWNKLRKQVIKYGVANSLLTACMPTASTSQIMGNNECIEPYTENIYIRTTGSGDFYVINKHMVDDLIDLGLWNEDTSDLIRYYQGSIANVPGVPDNIKKLYRTVWEIPQRSIIEMAADRGPFIDQTQSMNLYISKANFIKLNSCLFKAWELGLKTGMYYLHSKAASQPGKFGIDANKIKEIEKKFSIEPETTGIEYNDEEIEMNVCKFVPGRAIVPGSCEMCEG